MTKARWSSLGLSLLVIVVLVIWMATGEVKEAREQAPEESTAAETSPTHVQVRALAAETYQPMLRLQGQLEPWQSVDVGARVAGTVEQLHVALGDRIEAGQPLLTLSTDGRDSVVTQRRARVRKLAADLDAARSLGSRNLAAKTDILGLESDLAAARAELEAAELALSHLEPEAPIAGMINRREVDEGALVQVGTPLFEIVQVARLKATGHIPQQEVAQVAVGQTVTVTLLDGTELAGQVSFVASAADSSTRTFAVEVDVDNPERHRTAGASATLNIHLPERQAMFVSPAYLALDDAGRPGLKYVDSEDRVVFGRVRLLNVSSEGAWVTGLPDEVRLITRGAGFVSEGDTVVAVDATDGQG